MLSGAGRNNVRCLNHAQVIIFAARGTILTTATSTGTWQRTPFSSFEGAAQPHEEFSEPAPAPCLSVLGLFGTIDSCVQMQATASS